MTVGYSLNQWCKLRTQYTRGQQGTHCTSGVSWVHSIPVGYTQHQWCQLGTWYSQWCVTVIALQCSRKAFATVHTISSQLLNGIHWASRVAHVLLFVVCQHLCHCHQSLQGGLHTKKHITHVHTHTCAHTHMCTHTHTHTHTHTGVHRHIQTHTCAHTYRHTHKIIIILITEQLSGTVIQSHTQDHYNTNH